MDPRLEALTPKQRRVYLLRQEGLTFQAIGEKMGTSGGRAAAQMRLVERRFREYEHFQKAEAWNRQEIMVTMSQGELRALIHGLSWWLDGMRTDERRDNAGGEWLDRLPYQMRVVKEFAERLQIDLYGEAAWGAFDEDGQP